MRIAAILALLVLATPSLALTQVDPQGAIRALGSTRHHHRHHSRHHRGIRIPRHFRHARRHAEQLPPGTSRPGPSRNFIPAR